jgi:ribonuclease III
LPKRRDTALRHLSERLGYEFKDPKLLALALTHSSSRPSPKPNEDNERLEFLGDRVLGLGVAEILSESFPEASEGELARWYSNLVRAETCAEIAQEWQLGPFIRIGGGKAGLGAARMLGDACEAILGAIFVEGGYEAAREVVRKFWTPRLSAHELAGPSAKSMLQEWAQGRKLQVPRYIEVAREGPDHAPHFTTEVQIEGLEPERGQGSTKQAAEQAAALAMLLREGVWQSPET